MGCDRRRQGYWHRARRARRRRCVGGLAWGLFNGFCVTRLRVPARRPPSGHPRSRARHRQPDHQRQRHLRCRNEPMIDLQISNVLGFPWIVWLALVVVNSSVEQVLRYTRFGRHTYVIGSNDEAARRAGINVNSSPGQALRHQRRSGRPGRDDVAGPVLHDDDRRSLPGRADGDHRRHPRRHEPVRRLRRRARHRHRHLHPDRPAERPHPRDHRTVLAERRDRLHPHRRGLPRPDQAARSRYRS